MCVHECIGESMCVEVSKFRSIVLWVSEGVGDVGVSVQSLTVSERSVNVRKWKQA